MDVMTLQRLWTNQLVIMDLMCCRPFGDLVILELAFCACGYRLVCSGSSS
uniref:Uncharacterized protein n=1 Tax=Triticum urartu TaxID=4572 RepID=A0A8R7VB24_TRIUA